jgi:ATP-binding protein involved in chromosome partitioning
VKPGVSKEEAKRRLQLMITMKTKQKMIEDSMKKIRYKIGIISGKGGVGKSTVTANLSLTLADKGYNVGIIDSDFHGPSIPKILGIEKNKIVATEDKKLIPVEGPLGIKVMSIYYFLPDPTTAVIWRGPLKKSFLEEILASTAFGELDFLMVDLPPGTGDEALNLIQSVPDLTGLIAVTQPTEVSSIAVAKSIDFALRAGVKVLGIIENMSGFLCPKEDKIYKVFPGDGGKMLSEMYSIPLLGTIPIDPMIADSSDKGITYILERREARPSQEFHNIADKLINNLEK